MPNESLPRTARLALGLAAALAGTLLLGGLAGCDKRTSDRDVVLVGLDDGRALVGERKGLLGRTSRGAWLDPRDRRAWRLGHLPGAIHVPLEEIRERRRELEDYDVVVVYGDGWEDPLPVAAAKILRDVGIEDVRTLDGGVKAWTAAGLELVPGDD